MKANLSVGTKGWADRINAAWRRSAASIIETGQLLIECKKTVGHGAWKNMLATELDFEEHAAQRLMAIGRDVRLSNPSILMLLPPSYTALYDLTKLPDDQFEQALKSGEINPKMKGSDVPKKRKESPQGDAVSAEGSSDVNPVATAEVPTPQDDSEGGEAVVTEPWPDPGRLDPFKPEDFGVSAEAPAATSYEADQQPRAGAAGTVPAPPWPASAKQGMIAYYVDPTKPESAFANGLSIAMAAADELRVNVAAANFPEDMPLLSDDLDWFRQWLAEFSQEFRAIYDQGNEAALAAE